TSFSRDWSSDVCSSDLRLKSSTAKSKKLADGTIQIDYQGKYEVSECKQDEEYLTVKIDFPLHRADTLYAKMQFDAIDADGGLGKIGRASCRGREWDGGR